MGRDTLDPRDAYRVRFTSGDRGGQLTLLTDHREGTTWLTLNRPEKLNSFRAEDYRRLAAAVEGAHASPDVRAIVITGAGRAFSAGADRSLVDGSADEEERRAAGVAFAAMIEVLDRCDKPLLAAVNGLAVGIGCTVLLHCDLVLMAESARIRFPFTALGTLPEAGSSLLLPARVRWGDAAWGMLSSEWIDSSQALSMGFAWRLVPDAALVEEAERVTAILESLDPSIVAATKRLLVAGRADLVREAMRREYAELSRLREDPPS